MGRSRKKRSLKRVKWLLGIAAVLLVAVWGWNSGDSQHEVKDGSPEEERITRVMLLGVDRREDDVGRSDTLMIASLRKEDDKGALLSIPRDTRVYIEGHGYEKFNHAYAYGGHKLSQATAEKFLGVPIDHYVIIDTKAFERIIDAIGGVDLEVEKRMYYEDPWDDNGGLVIDLYPGEQHLDGERAIQYVRYRDGEGDIGRINRQQKFMKAVLEQVLSPDIIPRLPTLVEEIRGAVETDMSLNEFLSFARELEAVRSNGLITEMVPGKPAYLSDVSYWIPDVVGLRRMVCEDMNVVMSPELLADAERAAKEYEKAQPKDIQLLALEEKSDASASDTSAEKRKTEEKEKKEKKDSQESLRTNKEKIQEQERKKEQKEKEKKEKEEAPGPMRPEDISVMVINSSGINGAGAEVAEILMSKGYIISSVETGKTSSREHTTITTSAENTDLFYGMPFPCIIMDGGGKSQAVVNIGLDYRK